MHAKPTFQLATGANIVHGPLKSSTDNTTASNRVVLDEQLFAFKGKRSANSR